MKNTANDNKEDTPMSITEFTNEELLEEIEYWQSQIKRTKEKLDLAKGIAKFPIQDTYNLHNQKLKLHIAEALKRNLIPI